LQKAWKWIAGVLAALLVFSFLVVLPAPPEDSIGRTVPRALFEIPSSPSAVPIPVIQHVITIVFENANISDVLSHGPFERYLAQKYAFASNYYGVCHPSASNYLAMTSGRSWECGNDTYNVYSTKNVADLLETTGQTWAAYMETMPTPCNTTSNTTSYVVHHNPFVFYSDIVGNQSRCDEHDLPLTAFAPAVADGTLPNYVYISPNSADDGESTNVSFSDNWLKGFLSPLLNDSFFDKSVIFIAYDEANGDSSGYSSGGVVNPWCLANYHEALSVCGGHIYFTAVSPFVKQNYNYTADATDYNLLSTVEWLLGLGSTGNNDSAAFGPFEPMEAMFNVSAPPGTDTYSVTGRVAVAGTDALIPAATVSIPNTGSTITNSSGEYAFTLPNGTYTVTVSAAGYFSESSPVTVRGAATTLDFFLNVRSTAAGLPIWVWVGGGIGAVGLLVGGLYFAVRNRGRAIPPITATAVPAPAQRPVSKRPPR
jgi:hypothetical protein